MRKKRKKIGWGVSKKAIILSAFEKRQEEAHEMAKRFPNLQKKLREIRSRAEVILKPRYTTQNYTDELIALAKKWKKAGRLEARLKTLALLNGLPSRAGSNSYLSLVKGPLPHLDRRRASKIAAEIKRKMHE
jgi:hypothetical protein